MYGHIAMMTINNAIFSLCEFNNLLLNCYVRNCIGCQMIINQSEIFMNK